MRNYYVSGDWNAVCDRCGFKYKASALKKEWTGLRVCSGCFETRHPQTLIRVPQEHVNTPWARPESTDQFVNNGLPLIIETSTDSNNTNDWIMAEDGSFLLTEG